MTDAPVAGGATADDEGYPPSDDDGAELASTASYRSYEVYQRERVGQTTNLISPRDLIADSYLFDPFTPTALMREHYPCYRDWVGNRFWITRYDDVTSVFVDDDNYETRPKRLVYGDAIAGSDLGAIPAVRRVIADRTDAALEAVVSRLVDDLSGIASCDLVAGFTERLANELLVEVLGVDSGSFAGIARELGHLRDGVSWHDALRVRGVAAFGVVSAYFGSLLAGHVRCRSDGLVAACAELGASGDDLVCTLLELDHVTLPASLTNLWCLLLSNPDQLAVVRDDPRLMKFAYLEALRHSPPVLSADRHCRHEVERFGRLLPDGALLHLSAAAANRDPRQFADPDRFDVTRKDLCQREPRGQYRADGLPAGIAFGHGPPSRLPASPKDEPRSRYAVTRDVAVAASKALLERFPDIRLGAGSTPVMQSTILGGPYTCHSLVVELDAAVS